MAAAGGGRPTDARPARCEAAPRGDGRLLMLLQTPAERVHVAGQATPRPPRSSPAAHAGPHVAGVEAADHAQQALGGPGDEPVHDERAAHEPGQAQQAEAGELQGEQPVGPAKHRAARQRDHDDGVGGPGDLRESGSNSTRLGPRRARACPRGPRRRVSRGLSGSSSSSPVQRSGYGRWPGSRRCRRSASWRRRWAGDSRPRRVELTQVERGDEQCAHGAGVVDHGS